MPFVLHGSVKFLNTNYGNRSFAARGPKQWNSLPVPWSATLTFKNLLTAIKDIFVLLLRSRTVTAAIHNFCYFYLLTYLPTTQDDSDSSARHSAVCILKMNGWQIPRSTILLIAERQSARMSKITNDGLTRSGMLYSCTHTTTAVGVKELSAAASCSRSLQQFRKNSVDHRRWTAVCTADDDESRDCEDPVELLTLHRQPTNDANCRLRRVLF